MRNKSLDAAKAVAACLVVFIHVSFPGQVGQIIKVLARCAVPFFFMISGYFCYYEGKTAEDKKPSKILHILKLFFISLLFYLVWEYIMKFLSGEDTGEWLKELTDSSHLKEFALYNSTSVVRAHLWFLPALIYCYAVDFFVEKWKLRKAAYCCIPVLLAMLLWRAEFCRFFGGFYHTMEYRNFLFTGFGFYLTGQMIHEYQDKMYQCFVQKHTERHIKWLLIVGMAAGAALSILEYSFQNAREIYLGNCIAVICLFLWLVLYGKEKKISPILAEIGRKYAFLIYLLHPAVADIIKKFSQYVGIDSSLCYLWLRPLLVYGITLGMIQGVFTLNMRLKDCSRR